MQRERERRLLEDTLELWVTSRIASMPEEVCGEEKVATRVVHPSSPYYGTYLVPPVIYAQEETVLLTKIQRPLQQRVLAQLDALMKGQRRENWFTTYLSLFVLLHSCSLTMKRDAEFAGQMVSLLRYCPVKPEWVRVSVCLSRRAFYRSCFLFADFDMHHRLTSPGSPEPQNSIRQSRPNSRQLGRRVGTGQALSLPKGLTAFQHRPGPVADPRGCHSGSPYGRGGYTSSTYCSLGER